MFAAILSITAFVLTIVFVFWRPRGLNEAIPATCGASIVVLCGTVSPKDLVTITETVGGAATTILSTIVMAIVLESFGFFGYAAEWLEKLVRNSGIRLFWYINLLCFLMTLLFNNDGSILISTPILLILLKKLGLTPQQQIPYLLSGALIATASSAPIGVSNIVNLISLKIVGMSLYSFTAMMFIPAMMGLGILLMLLYFLLRNQLTVDLAKNRDMRPPTSGVFPEDAVYEKSPTHRRPGHAGYPGQSDLSRLGGGPNDRQALVRRARFMRNVFLYVLGVRISLFVASYLGIPVPVAAVIGAVGLLLWRWVRLKTSPRDIVAKTPWQILVFAFSMYVVIFGLHNIGLTLWLVHAVEPVVQGSWFRSVFVMGLLVMVMSNLFNNHPALMIGTLTLTSMALDPMTTKITYLGNVIGSDIGSLILPIGTLATLIWMHILKQHNVHISWRRYVAVTAIVIPVTAIATLALVYVWLRLVV